MTKKLGMMCKVCHVYVPSHLIWHISQLDEALETEDAAIRLGDIGLAHDEVACLKHHGVKEYFKGLKRGWNHNWELDEPIARFEIQVRGTSKHVKSEFRQGLENQEGDAHARTASAIFGLPPDIEVSRRERAEAKVVNFGLLYGRPLKE